MDEFDGASVIDSATHATRWDGLLFVPVALWTPDGWGDGVPAERLEAYSTAYLPTGVQPDGDNWLDFSNALWVRARLPVALGFAPPTCFRAGRRLFLNAAFLAVKVEENGPRVTPFVCTEADFRAELRFGQGCRAERRREIAAAFWGLLVSAPTALASYRDRITSPDGDDFGPTVAGFWRGQFHLSDGPR